MTYTIASAAISRATVRRHRYGVDAADEVVLVESPATLAAGQRATLTIGDLSMVGTLRPGGSFGGTSYWSWVAGAGRWDSTVGRRAYADTGGVMLSTVVADLARDAGEIGAVLEVSDRSLGPAWVRPAGLASAALNALSGGQWWLAADGVTHVGPRPAVAVSSPLLTVGSYDPALRRASVALANDGVALLAPGATLTADGLPAPLLIGSAILHVSAASVEVELYGERTGAELLKAIAQAATAGTRYHPPQPYTVAEVSGALASVKPSDARSIDFPEQPFLSQVPGVPGCTAVLQVGAGVLVAFPSGDPASPVIVGYAPGVLPDSVTLDAATEIKIGGSSAVELAKGGVVDLNEGLIVAKLNACCVALGIPPLGSLSSTKTTKAKGF